MIFVTLGTHPAPMDRVVAELDRLIEIRAIEDDVVIQAASFRLRPKFARAVTVIPYEQLLALISSADVVIAHAGPATLAQIRAAGRVPLVVPRSPSAGEHVDDHQKRYADRLRGLPGYIVIDEVSQLREAIECAHAMRADPSHADVTAAVAALERAFSR